MGRVVGSVSAKDADSAVKMMDNADKIGEPSSSECLETVHLLRFKTQLMRRPRVE